MDRPIRVAQVIGMAVNGGTEAFAMNYYEHIDRTKVQFDFLVESTSKIIDKDKIESMGGHVVIIPSYKNPFKYMKELTRIFKENEYDIVHSNMNALSVFTLKAAKKAGIKVRIAHSHSTSNKKEVLRNMIKGILKLFSKKYATHYFACSELAGRWLFGNKTYDSGKVTIINNGIDIERFKFNEDDRAEIRKLYNLGDSFVVGHVGRMMKQKNHEFLLKVFAEVKKTKANSKLLLVGDGPLKERIEKQAVELGIAEDVVFCGNQANVEKYYSAMDVFVFPSLYEGLGMTLVEAQVNGLESYGSMYLPSVVYFSKKSHLINSDHAIDWAKPVCNISFFNERETQCLCFLNSIYDIKAESSHLCDLYENEKVHE